MFDLRQLDDRELIEAYSQIITLLKEKGVIRSKNIVGDLGEYLAVEYYNNTASLPKLQLAPPNTQNVDALSIKGERYSIKATSSRLTSVFYGLNPPNSAERETPKFEYVVIVIFNDNFRLERILELNWELFLKFKKWHKTMRAWNIPITKHLLVSAKTIYSDSGN